MRRNLRISISDPVNIDLLWKLAGEETAKRQKTVDPSEIIVQMIKGDRLIIPVEKTPVK